MKIEKLSDRKIGQFKIIRDLVKHKMNKTTKKLDFLKGKK